MLKTQKYSLPHFFESSRFLHISPININVFRAASITSSTCVDFRNLLQLLKYVYILNLWIHIPVILDNTISVKKNSRNWNAFPSLAYIF